MTLLVYILQTYSRFSKKSSCWHFIEQFVEQKSEGIFHKSLKLIVFWLWSFWKYTWSCWIFSNS